MLSLDEEKMPTVPTPTNRNGHVTDSDVSGVTSSSPSPVQPSLAPTVEEEDEEDPVIKSCGWGMWLVYEVNVFVQRKWITPSRTIILQGWVSCVVCPQI